MSALEQIESRLANLCDLADCLSCAGDSNRYAPARFVGALALVRDELSSIMDALEAVRAKKGARR